MRNNVGVHRGVSRQRENALGQLTYYIEAFLEDPQGGWRWRVFNNGEGMIEFAYQEYRDGEWVKGEFQGWPSSEVDALIAAVQVVRDSS